MVRLKHESIDENFDEESLFQSHNGSIKTTVNIKEQKENL